MSNMGTKRNNAKPKGKQIADKLEVNRNLRNSRQEEFESEFDFNAASAKEKNFVEAQGKTGIKQPVSERTAWH
ncbi:hypothetical protein ACTHOQ_07605 [Solibacillus silvestris]|uniref:hypothetical protein n=1 Tax=Solibacillus silvestris TaxID=76853 RepID=UPI003F7E316B